MKKTFYSLTDTADILNVHVRTIRRWINEGKLKAYQPGGRKMIIPVSSIIHLLKNSEVKK